MPDPRQTSLQLVSNLSESKKRASWSAIIDSQLQHVFWFVVGLLDYNFYSFRQAISDVFEIYFIHNSLSEKIYQKTETRRTTMAKRL